MPPAAGAPRQIIVPGSISNLGPAFDALSVAVDVYLHLDIHEVLPGRPGLVEMDFAGGAPAGENRIETGFRRATEQFGQAAPGVRLSVRSDIPIRAGLGSSAAATVAGLRLYEALTAPRNPTDLMIIASAIEGHPDNAAAAMLGGLTLSCQRDDGGITTCSWTWPAGLKFVVGTPGAELETAFARKVLPERIPMRDAVYNLQRALLLVHALATGRYELLREALRDRWHQPPRQQYVPGLAEALALDDPAILGVCLSGAGPSIAMLVADDGQRASAALSGIYSRLGLPYTIRSLSAHPPASPSSGTHS
jgi:homoserine kinase